MTPITWPRLRRLAGYHEFVARFGWAANEVSEVDFYQAMDRLRRYHRRLAAVREPAGNPYLELVRILLDGGVRPGLARLLDLPTRRRELVTRFAWAVPGPEALAALARLGPLVESGAGTGYWAALLAGSGVDIVACDAQPAPPGRQWYPVTTLDAVAAVRRHRDRTLLLCWPPYDSDAAGYDALRGCRGEMFVYIGDAPVGDGPDGATGTPRLHRELALNWAPVATVPLPNWPGLRDRLTLYRRAPVRRPHTVRDRCDECRRFVPTGTIGRCAWCRRRHPVPLTLRAGEHRLEYPQQVLDSMPPALVAALQNSRNRLPSAREGE